MVARPQYCAKVLIPANGHAIIDCIDSNDSVMMRYEVATLTIRNLNKETKAKLRQIAAEHGHSMEEEARRILDRAVNREERKGLGSEIVQLFAEVGGANLPIPPRAPARTPNMFAEEEP